MPFRKPRWQTVTVVMVGVALASLVVLVVTAVRPEAEVSLADAVAVLVAAATAVVATAVWSHRSATTAPTRAEADAAAQELAELVDRQWRAEARHRLLHDPEPIPVLWRLTADEKVMSPARLVTGTAEPATFTGSATDIAALARAFQALPRHCLVITGGPGMGKTTLAVQLLLQLLATRAADLAGAEPGEVVPVPVLLPVSGWDVDAYPRLHDWLAVRLAQDYPSLAGARARSIPAGVRTGPLGVRVRRRLGTAATLAYDGHILPVLDGLDEIGGSARAKVISALNASLTSRDQLILTSRSVEFGTAVRQAGRPLTGAAVIAPKRLSPETAAGYLRDCLPATPTEPWQKVLAALSARAAPGLTALAGTPLGLWLIRTVYVAPGADPSPLTGHVGADLGTLRTHLLDRLIPALIETRPPSADPADHFRPRRRLDPDDVRRHLGHLARHFHATRDIAWWRIARTAPRFPLVAWPVIWVSTVIVCMALCALVSGVAAGVVPGPGTGPLFGMFTGLIDGSVIGLGFGLAIGVAALLGTARDRRAGSGGRTVGSGRTSRGARLRSLARHVGVRLAAGATFGLVFGAIITLVDSLLTGLLLGISTGFAVALAIHGSWLDETPGHADLRLRRRGAITALGRGLAHGLVFGLTAGMAFGLVLFVAIGVLIGMTDPLTHGLPFALRGGLVFGLVFGVAVGLIKWAEQPKLVSFSTPRSTWRADRTLTLFRGVAISLMFGLVMALTAGLWLREGTTTSVAVMTEVVIEGGLQFGLVYGLVAGRHHAWLACLVAMVRLAVTGRLPWRVMRFLDDVHRLGLLRTVGPVYQFRHADLHDHLAATAPTRRHRRPSGTR
ncbi:hypothetical protein ACBJ59_19255 [Nonomuraea sp. MTCD27]|uniref:hypothetical protein n=1 Tax=Nonomuraea sp. MTCD27 TaxID=1676747 RepID=UPI0035C19409